MHASYRRSAALLAVLSMAALTAGCASNNNAPPPPVEYGNQARGGMSANTYRVQRGDTIYGVARQFNLSVRSLIDANNLQPPYQLSPRQILFLSASSTYVVQKGDTLLGVARRTGTNFSTLARINDLSAPYTLKVGQTLKMPSGAKGGGGDARTAQNNAGSMPPPVAAAPLPEPKPADAKGGKYQTLADREKASDDIPPPPPPPSSSGVGANDVAPPPPAPPPSSASSASAAAEQKTAATAPLPSPPKVGKGFIWPARGDIISEYGSTGRGQHNDGINIALPAGTPVVAADDGVVAYSGNELRGFGNLLLIKHADGWMTAYAHNDTLLVKRGQVVKRGQQIAKSGDSGGVSQPQLHFEIRRGTRAMDPMPFLTGKTNPASAQADQQDPG